MILGPFDRVYKLSISFICYKRDKRSIAVFYGSPQCRKDIMKVMLDSGVELMLQVVIDLPCSVVEVKHGLVKCAELSGVEGRKLREGLRKGGLELVPAFQEQLNSGFMVYFGQHTRVNSTACF